MSRVVFIVTIFAFTLTYAEPSFARHNKLPRGKPFSIITALINAAKATNHMLNQVSLVSEEVDDMQARVDGIDRRLYTVEDEVSDLQFQVDNVQARLDANDWQIASMQDQIGNLEGDLTNLKWITDDLLSQIESNVGDIDALGEQVSTNEAMITDIKTDIASLKELVQALQMNPFDSCPEGSTINGVEDGVTICESDDGIDGISVVTTLAIVPGGALLHTELLSCSSGTTMLGMGYSNLHPAIQIVSSLPAGKFWLVQFSNADPFIPQSVVMFSRCGKYGAIPTV